MPEPKKTLIRTRPISFLAFGNIWCERWNHSADSRCFGGAEIDTWQRALWVVGGEMRRRKGLVVMYPGGRRGVGEGAQTTRTHILRPFSALAYPFKEALVEVLGIAKGGARSPVVVLQDFYATNRQKHSCEPDRSFIWPSKVG